MASTYKFITPEERVKKDVGTILADHLSFLNELSRQSAALPDKIDTRPNKNTPATNHCKPNHRPNSK